MADNPAYDGETMKDKEKLEPHGNFDVPGEKGGGGTAGFLSVGNPPISLNACTPTVIEHGWAKTTVLMKNQWIFIHFS